MGDGRLAIYRLDGKQVEDVARADVAAGELEVFEKHWSTGEYVYGPDGVRSTVILRGKVEVIENQAGGSSGNCSSGSYTAPPYSCCPMCGGSCPPDGCYNCCLQAPAQVRIEVRVCDGKMSLNNVQYDSKALAAALRRYCDGRRGC